jgi:hypothetical protein
MKTIVVYDAVTRHRQKRFLVYNYVRMSRGGRGLPKVLPGLAIPNSSKPCGRVAHVENLYPLLMY